MQFFPFFSFFCTLVLKKKQGRKADVAPAQCHHSSIASPSKRWTNDGVSMEYLRMKSEDRCRE